VSQTPSTRYLSADDVWAMNDDILRRDGGQSLLRDRGALEGAMTRPQTAAYYEQADLITQAAVLIAGIAMAHPFFDGNKRTAAVAGAVFLGMNGYRIASVDDEYGRQIEALVTHPDTLDAATQRFIDWLRPLVVPRA